MSSFGFPFNNSGKKINIPSNFNVNTSHPIIPNSQEYIYYKKYVSIHSEDRDMIKYPDSSTFEIEMPEDLLNVMAIRLYDWSFPCNYNTFSNLFSNTTMSFRINNPYNPNTNGLSDLLAQKIFECLYYRIDKNFVINIEDGFYNPVQMAKELTNKFNESVTREINAYFKENSAPGNAYEQAQQLFLAAGGYNNFVIVYDSVGNKIWYGNTSDGFILTTEIEFINSTCNKPLNCAKLDSNLPDYASWGLPGFLGLERINTPSISGSVINDVNKTYYGNNIVPRFYYGDVLNSGDNGYWLLPNPNLPGSEVHWVNPPYKINLMGPSHIYMELVGQNCIDETSPYNISNFTITNNKTNGIVNSSFAKISIPTTPISQWFDKDSGPYKFYYPPAERMRRLSFKFRFHNGQPAFFGTFNYTFTLEFTLQLPQILRDSIVVKYPENFY